MTTLRVFSCSVMSLFWRGPYCFIVINKLNRIKKKSEQWSIGLWPEEGRDSPVSGPRWTSRNGTGRRCAVTGSATTFRWRCPPRRPARGPWPGHRTWRRTRHTVAGRMPIRQTCSTLPVRFPFRHRSRLLWSWLWSPSWIFEGARVFRCFRRRFRLQNRKQNKQTA